MQPLKGLTVTVKLQVGPALLVQVTVVVPRLNIEPEDGSQVITSPEQALVVGAV
jgi:hypothetical protein